MDNNFVTKGVHRMSKKDFLMKKKFLMRVKVSQSRLKKEVTHFVLHFDIQFCGSMYMIPKLS